MVITERYKYGRLFKERKIYKEDEVLNGKALIKEDSNHITVTSTSGKEFDADPLSRQNISDGIQIGIDFGMTSHLWKLADNTVLEVTIEELKEVRMLALLAYGNLIGV